MCWTDIERVLISAAREQGKCENVKRSQNLHKIISTHLLTVLIMRVIVHTEQRKRKRNLPEKILTEFSDVFRNSKLKTAAQHAANIDQEE